MCNLKQLHILHDLRCLFLLMGYLTCGLIFQARTWQWLKTCNLFIKRIEVARPQSQSCSHTRHTIHPWELDGQVPCHFFRESSSKVWAEENRISGWWFGTWISFFYIDTYILGIVIPTDFNIFQRGRSTTNQNIIGEIQHQSVKGFRSWSYLGWWTPPLTSMYLFRCWYDKGTVDPFGNLSLALPNHVLYVATVSPNQFTNSLL